ncbi:hypothetical protein IY145_00295 [Methylosinus sp. H3A]|nr:hypothetical protein [Methylosinus sp. H3A]MBG0807882.1 hypothetical protein [Methylosinus sp. H3A]
MTLSSLVEKPNRRTKEDFKWRHFKARLIIHFEKSVTVQTAPGYDHRIASYALSATKHYSPTIGIFEGETSVEPIGVFGVDRFIARSDQSVAQARELLSVWNIQDQQVVPTGGRAWAPGAVLCEFQMIGPTGKAQHEAIVSTMIGKSI